MKRNSFTDVIEYLLTENNRIAIHNFLLTHTQGFILFYFIAFRKFVYCIYMFVSYNWFYDINAIKSVQKQWKCQNSHLMWNCTPSSSVSSSTISVTRWSAEPSTAWWREWYWLRFTFSKKKSSSSFNISLFVLYTYVVVVVILSVYLFVCLLLNYHSADQLNWVYCLLHYPFIGQYYTTCFVFRGGVHTFAAAAARLRTHAHAFATTDADGALKDIAEKVLICILRWDLRARGVLTLWTPHVQHNTAQNKTKQNKTKYNTEQHKTGQNRVWRRATEGHVNILACPFLFYLSLLSSIS